MNKKLMLIVNPVAGKGAYKAGFADAMQILSAGGYVTSLYFTTARGDATAFAAEYAKDYDVVACIGGDGTLSEVITGLMSVDNPPPLGYIPMGTANDVATTLDLPKNDTAAAARRIISGTPHPYDVGGFGDNKYFAYIAAFGAFTDVSYATPQSLKKNLGHLAYVLEGMSALPFIEKTNVHIEYDDGELDETLIYGSMSNSTSVAGIVKLNENMVSLGDGLSELVLVRDPGSLIGLNEIINSLLTRRYDNDKLLVLHTKKARFTFEKPIAWTIDGESGGKTTDITLVNHKCPVSLIF